MPRLIPPPPLILHTELGGPWALSSLTSPALARAEGPWPGHWKLRTASTEVMGFTGHLCLRRNQQGDTPLPGSFRRVNGRL